MTNPDTLSIALAEYNQLLAQDVDTMFAGDDLKQKSEVFYQAVEAYIHELKNDNQAKWMSFIEQFEELRTTWQKRKKETDAQRAYPVSKEKIRSEAESLNQLILSQTASHIKNIYGFDKDSTEAIAISSYLDVYKKDNPIKEK
jgi:metal-responsive CopG/Arc/MetJ family transcriptional regulator